MEECECPVPCPVIMYTSWTPDNPSRKFLRCPSRRCWYFKWIDPAPTLTPMDPAPTLPIEPAHSAPTDVPTLLRRIEQMEEDIVAQRRKFDAKTSKLYALLVICIAIIFLLLI